MERRFLFIVDGEYRSVEGDYWPDYWPEGTISSTRATIAQQAAYEFGRQEKAQEILEALTREFLKGEKP